jgi:DNA polymerase-3 subunit epsilon
MDLLFSPTTPVEDLPFIFVDVETTGLNVADGDRVCEIALLRVQSGQEIARFESLIHPQRHMGAGATAVNGITDAMLTSAPLFPALIPSIRDLLQNAVFVAHNAPFDLGFLRHEFGLANQTFTVTAAVDTLVLAQAHYRFPHNSLEAIATSLGLANHIRHRAMADVQTTRQVLQHFIADLTGKSNGQLVLAHLMHPADRRSVAELDALMVIMRDALQRGKLLHLRYQASNAEETARVVEPLEVSYQRGRGYLRAFCHLRQEERNFRFDRIRTIKMVTEP